MEIIINSKKYGECICHFDDEDYEKIKHYTMMVSGRLKSKYVRLTYYDKCTQKTIAILAHNKIMRCKGIDHIDRNGLNNCKTNLRKCTQQQNSHNQSIKCTNTTGFKGVCFDNAKGKYSCFITLSNKHIFGGYFNNPIDAAKKYNELASKYFGEYACLNIITQNDIDKYSHIKGRYLKPKSNNKSGYRGVGVSNQTNKIFSKITYNKKQIHLGTFNNFKDAAIAYNNAALKYYGDDALLNKI